jgi:hypothetical protein
VAQSRNTLSGEAVLAIEGMVDRTSVAAVLEALGNICYEKAEHLREAWQDHGAAKTWEKDGKRIHALSLKVYT